MKGPVAKLLQYLIITLNGMLSQDKKQTEQQHQLDVNIMNCIDTV